MEVKELVPRGKARKVEEPLPNQKVAAGDGKEKDRKEDHHHYVQSHLRPQHHKTVYGADNQATGRETAPCLVRNASVVVTIPDHPQHQRQMP